MEEIWKPLHTLEHLYEISSLGRVRSLDKQIKGRPGCKSFIMKGRIIKTSIGPVGYLRLTVGVNRKPVNFNIHRLIAIAFIPNPNNLPCVNHKDLNKLNNSLNNLEWCTHSQNSKHAFENGKMPGSFKEGENGATVKNAKTGEIFKTIKEAAKTCGVSKKRLAHMVSGRCRNLTDIVKI